MCTSGSRVTRTKCGLDLPLLNQSLQSSPVLLRNAVTITVSVEDAWGKIFKMCNSNWDQRASFYQLSMHTCSPPRGPGWIRRDEAFHYLFCKSTSRGLSVPMSNQNSD